MAKRLTTSYEKAGPVVARLSKVRNTLIRDLYYDFDLKNAQVEIIRNICQQNNIPCEMVVDYCDRRKNVLKKISDKYSVSRRAAKKLVLRLSFFGTFWGWCKDNGLSGATETLWITNFIREPTAVHEV